MNQKTGIIMPDNDKNCLDRRQILRGSALALPGLVVSNHLTIADDQKKAADAPKSTELPKVAPADKAKEPEKAAVSAAEAEIDRRLVTITSQFGDRLTSAETVAVRADVSANYFRARRLRAMPLADFEGPCTAFIPHRKDLTPVNQPADAIKIEPKALKLDDSLAFATIFELAAGLRGRLFTAVELAGFYLDR
ncbi:MAG: hypothetical protein ACKO0V_20290, partial [bacterium]